MNYGLRAGSVSSFAGLVGDFPGLTRSVLGRAFPVTVDFRLAVTGRAEGGSTT